MMFFFFFQAEDGIRDYKVTGVQTCALPILGAGPQPRNPSCRGPAPTPRAGGRCSRTSPAPGSAGRSFRARGLGEGGAGIVYPRIKPHLEEVVVVIVAVEFLDDITPRREQLRRGGDQAGVR